MKTDLEKLEEAMIECGIPKTSRVRLFWNSQEILGVSIERDCPESTEEVVKLLQDITDWINGSKCSY